MFYLLVQKQRVMNQSFNVPVGGLKSPSVYNVTVDVFFVKALLCWDPLSF